MTLSNIPDDKHVSKGFLRELLDMLFNEYPELQRYMPAVLTTITKYIPSELVENFHYFEGLLNQFMEIYRSNLTEEEKIDKIQQILPTDMLSNNDIKELFTMLDSTFDMMQNNINNYPEHLLNKNQNYVEFLNSSSKVQDNPTDNNNNLTDIPNDNHSIDSTISNINNNSLNGMIHMLQNQVKNKINNMNNEKDEKRSIYFK